METYKERFDRITNHLLAGGQVMVVTYTKGTIYGKKHAGMFKATENGLYVRRGRTWDCLNFTPIKFSKLQERN